MIAGLLLAAGTSSRMGGHKLLLPLAGKPVAAYALDAALDAGCLDVVVVVVGRDAGLVEAALARPARVRFVLNPDFASGVASSLRAGLRAMAEDVDAAVVLLADQPEVRSDAIVRVAQAFDAGDTGPIVQASYGGRAAHPTLLARRIWPELEALTGDAGARRAVARHPEWRTSVEVGGDPPDDIDTQEDYARAVARSAPS